MKTLDPDHLAPKQSFKLAKGCGDFACSCVCVEFRFHLIACACAFPYVASENQALGLNKHKGFVECVSRENITSLDVLL